MSDAVVTMESLDRQPILPIESLKANEDGVVGLE
jgi:hypothetical protein